MTHAIRGSLAALLLACACAPGEAPHLADSAAPAAADSDSWFAGVERRIAAEERAIHARDGAFEARMPAVGRAARFDAEGVTITGDDGEPALDLATLAFGREDDLVPLAAVAPALGACGPDEGPTGACVQRLEYAWDDLTEWWFGLDDGLEQGWTVQTPPPGEGALAFEVAVDGALSVEPEGDGLALTDAGGQVWTAGAVVAWDAQGALLPAWIEPSGAGLRVIVDDEGASYPVTVDPIYSTAAWRFIGDSTGYFGRVVAGAGDIDGDGRDDVIVGSYDTGFYTGSVYVYHGTSSGLPSTPDLVLQGEDAGDYFGASCAGAGDVDGDGYDDVIVGAHTAGTGAGVAYLYTGSAAGLDPDRVQTLSAPSGADDFGKSVAAAGDVDGDGLGDVIVGASGTSSSTGSAYLYEGSASGLGTTPATALTGSATSNYFGTSVAGAGDVDGDGYDDVLVGAYRYSSDTGRAYLYQGSSAGLASAATATLDGTSHAYFGFSVAGAGDVDADGYDDVIVGAYGYSSYTGRAYVYHGSAAGLSTLARTALVGEASSNYLGYSVTGLGDVNNDGFDDVAVGAYGYSSSTGRVYVHRGSAAGVVSTAATTLTGSGSSSYFGSSIAAAGDTGGDGYDDLLVGAYGYSSNAGRVARYSGTSSGVATTAYDTLDPPDRLGSAVVAGAGDLDGDGYRDVAVGCPSCVSGAGRVYVFLSDGGDLPVIADATLVGSGTSSDYFGFALDAAEDVNGDGYGDLVVGEYDYSSYYGRVYVYHGGASGLATSATTTITASSSHRLGYSVSGAGDVDGDGYDDIIAGAYFYSSSTGRAYLYRGSTAGISSTAAATWTGSSSSDFGWEVEGGGDVDGDGYDDVAIAAMGYSSDQGRVTVYLGDAAGIGTSASTTLDGEASYDYFGDQLAFCDVDGDGYDDLIVGAYGYSSSAGRVYVYPGTALGTYFLAATTITGASGEYFGEALDCAGDVDGDGCEDVVVGTTRYYTSRGQVRLYLGSAAGLSTTPAVSVTGQTSGIDWGYSVAGAGDIDGDGLDDVLVGGDEQAVLYRGYAADADLDGSPDAVDCDDADPAVYPGAVETCNGVDDDCDGATDEGAPTWYPDLDGDGYGRAAGAVSACSAPTGHVATSGDCADASAAIHPGATETCNGTDDDCDGTVDEGAPTWYPDADSDGYGDAAGAVSACTAPAGHLATSGDCDDGAADVYPGAPETCDGRDEDCDGSVDEAGATGLRTFYRDADGDGYGDATGTAEACTAPSGYVADATDCDDGAASVHPAATEACNGTDDDCDGATDEAGASGETTWYADADGDGFGSTTTVRACTVPSGYVATATDCDDTSAAVHPGATEACNGADDDCDGAADEAGATGETTWHADADGDGYGSPTTTRAACTQPSGHVATATDCDDGDAAINPAATEACNGTDDDCDGSTDEAGATGETTWYADADGDGYGSPTVTHAACTQPSGYVANATDCDDASSTVHPGATEACNGADDDCDGSADEGTPTGSSTFFLDSDGDGYGSTSYLRACTAPSGYTDNYADCDDTDAAVSPAAPEICDEADNDCDGDVDDDDSAVTGAPTWYQDADRDGYGTAATTTTACEPDTGWADNDEDCDDSRSGTHPGATEVCGGADEDCDGQTDEPGATGETTFWADGDGDGYGSALDPLDACAQPDGYAAHGDDCDDADASVGLPTDWLTDADGDGYGTTYQESACEAPEGTTATAGDCDDTDPTAHPGAGELWYDGTDQDCDGNDDDQDGDGFGLAEDCDDLDAAIHEGCPTADDTGDGDGDGDGKDPGGCGCAAPARPTGLGAALLALAALAVRRPRGGRDQVTPALAPPWRAP